MRWMIALLLCVCGTLPALAKCDDGEKVIRLGLPNDALPSVRQRAAKLFVETTNKELQGKACATILNDKALYAGALSVTALQTGSIEMAAPSFDGLGQFAPIYQAFGLPFAFRNFQSVEKYISASKENHEEALESTGVVPLTIWLGHFSQLAAKRPVYEPKELTGMKVRIDDKATSATLMRELINQLKATTHTVPENDLSVALKTGRLDAQISSWKRMQDDKTATLLKNVMQTNHHIEGFQLLAAQSWWNGLDEPLRKALTEIVQRVSRQANFETQRQAVNARRAAMRSGIAIRILTRKLLGDWRKETAEFWADFKNEPAKRRIAQANLGL